MSSNFLSSFVTLEDDKSEDLMEQIMADAVKDRSQQRNKNVEKGEDKGEDKEEEDKGEDDEEEDDEEDPFGLDDIIDDEMETFKKSFIKTNLDERRGERRGERREVAMPFTHSSEGVLVRGTHKGVDVDVKYIMPGKLEIEFGVNEEIRSTRQLSNGDMIDNCVVLADLGSGKYLGHCKKVTFLELEHVHKYDDINVEIRGGPLSGVEGVIKTEYRPRVGVLLNGSPVTVDPMDIFFKDLLLKDGTYFQVDTVRLRPTSESISDYLITGKRFGSSDIQTISKADIDRMIPGFFIGVEGETERGYKDEKYIDDTGVEDAELDTDAELEDANYGPEYDEQSEQLDQLDTDTFDEQLGVATFRDKERVSSSGFAGWTGKQKTYVGLVKSILGMLALSDDTVNERALVERIESVLGDFDKVIRGSGENFNIFSSLVDVRMITACLVAYEIVSKGSEFGGFTVYVSTLYKAGYFTGDVVTSVLVELPELFPCTELKRTRVAYERVRMLMECYNRLIRGILNIQVNTDRVVTLPASASSGLEAVVAKERMDRNYISPEDFAGGLVIDKTNVNKRIVWGSKYKERIQRWKKLLDDRATSSRGMTSKIYSFIRDNVEKSPLVLYQLRLEVIDILGKIYDDFKYVDGVTDNYIDEYIERFLRSVMDKSLRVNVDQYTTVYKYLRLRDFVREFLADVGRFIEYTKSQRAFAISERERLRGVLLERRAKIQSERPGAERPGALSESKVKTGTQLPRQRQRVTSPKTSSDVLFRGKLVPEHLAKGDTTDMIRETLQQVFKESFDKVCDDDDCRLLEVLERVRRVLSTQDQMLLSPDQLAMFRKFASDHESRETKPPVKLPKIILKLRKPQV